MQYTMKETIEPICTQTTPQSGNVPNVGDSRSTQQISEAILLQQGICRRPRLFSTYIIRRDKLGSCLGFQQDLLRNGTASWLSLVV
jgi:hypothetical protein